ncbi:MAG: CHASE2 domain-containing protein [Bacteroidetes bacterium]|nr:CHASE2 domain-containing protein [Bacteroidota bacterium]
MKFWLNCLFVTVFTFLLLGLLGKFLQMNALNAFDPISAAIGDIEISDIAFSQLREGEPEPDPNITVVNIGKLGRGEIGDQIKNIARFRPKIIGIDAIFSCEVRDSVNCPAAFDPVGNKKFTSAIEEAEKLGIKVVMAEKLHQTDQLKEQYGDVERYDSLEHSDPELLRNSYEGFVNLITDAEHQEDLKLCREFKPMVMVKDQPQYAFEVMIAKLYDSAKAEKFLARGNENEVINYRGNTPDLWGASTYSGRYQFLDVHEALDTSSFTPEMIQDKIIIMGYHGENLFDKSWEDKFFTPLNTKYTGRSRPDMYGVTVHANVVSMIIDEDYIDTMPEWITYLMAFLVVFFTSAIFFLIDRKIPVWFDLLSLVIQFLLFVAASFVMIIVFSYYSYKMELTVILAGVAVIGTSFELYKGGAAVLAEFWNEKMAKTSKTEPDTN